MTATFAILKRELLTYFVSPLAYVFLGVFLFLAGVFFYLGIALTDVVGMDAFLADFDLYFAKLFDGLRHDSGDPFAWGEKALAHYQRLRIDAHTKRLVFSDGLDLPAAMRLYEHFADRTQLGFGIGTSLTNDCGLVLIQIVMKLTHANGQPVAKLSDSPGKTICDDATFLAYLRQVFGVTG